MGSVNTEKHESPQKVLQNIFSKKYLPALDGLRFVAVLMVLLDHGGIQHLGGDGVTYFFVLSGFLFSWILCRQWERDKTISFRRFYFRRTFRIVPACYCCLVFTIVAKNLLGLPVDYAHAVSAFTYTANYYNALYNHPPTGFSFFWSLAVEEQFYLIWPILFLFFIKRGRKSLMRFLLISIIFICTWRCWLAWNEIVSHAWLYNAFDTRIDSIAIGCLFGLLIRENWFQLLLHRLTQNVWSPLLPFGLLVFVHSLPRSFHYSLGFTVESVLMGILLVQMIVLSNCPFWSWLNWKPIRFLGVLSYSMYLYHAWGLAAGRVLSSLPLEGQVLAGVLFTIILATASYYLVELPFQKLRDRWEPAFCGERESKKANNWSQSIRPALQQFMNSKKHG